MSKVFLTSDLHLGHYRILKFQPNRVSWMQEDLPGYDINRKSESGGYHIHAMYEMLRHRWAQVVRDRDIVWVLGDVAFYDEERWLQMFSSWPGTKHLVLGNHDTARASLYEKYFDSVRGFVSKYKMWLSHPPINECELRNKMNLHGHSHSDIPQPHGSSWYDVGVDANNGYPVSLQHIRNLT